MGREDPHTAVEHTRRAIPTAAMDYPLLTAKGVKFTEEMKEFTEHELEGNLKVLVIRD